MLLRLSTVAQGWGCTPRLLYFARSVLVAIF